jgi:hypothetical protein
VILACPFERTYRGVLALKPRQYVGKPCTLQVAASRGKSKDKLQHGQAIGWT